MSKLIFSPDGTRLLHCNFLAPSIWIGPEIRPFKSFKISVQVWDVVERKLLYRVPGYLLGLSRDGESFLTQPAKTDYRAWETATGKAIAPATIDPNDYALAQRIDLFHSEKDIYLRDALGQRPFQQITLRYRLTNLALGLDDKSLVVTTYHDVGFADAAFGDCLDLETGAVRFEFDVARFTPTPPLFFSAEHNLLLIDAGTGCAAHNLTSGEIVFKVEDMFNASFYCVSPVDPNFLAAGTRGNTIYLVDVLSGQKRVLKTHAGQIRAMAFHPDGVHLAISMTRGGLQLWNAQSGELDRQFT